MLKGVSTTELYEQCLNSGICKEHQKELKIQDESGIHELQRKALLYIRLQIFGPILFEKPFKNEKMRSIFTLGGHFTRNAPNQTDDKFVNGVLLLDSVVVFTLCKICKICCAGALFSTNQKLCANAYAEAEEVIVTLLKIITTKELHEADVRCFNPYLTENFPDYDNELVKISYVAALLYVRNVTKQQKLRKALVQQDMDFQSLSKEGEQWNEIGSDAFRRNSWEEAIDAFTKALNYNPYCVALLVNRAHSYMKMNELKAAILDCHVALMISPTCITAYWETATCLYILSEYQDCITMANYGLEMCRESSNEDLVKYNALEKIRIGAGIALTKENVRMRALDDPEEKDVPELIAASDSETECQDVPDLLEASNSDLSDSEPEWSNSEMNCQPSTSSGSSPERTDIAMNCQQSTSSESPSDRSHSEMNWQSSTASGPAIEKSSSQLNCQPSVSPGSSIDEKASTEEKKINEPAVPEAEKVESYQEKHETPYSDVNGQPPTSSGSSVDEQVNPEESKDKKPVPEKDVASYEEKDNTEEKINILKTSLKEASQALLDGHWSMAIRRFRDALDEIKASPEIHKYEECDVICIKYAYAFACYNSDGFDDLQKAISLCKEIIDDHKNIAFPAAYYCIGLAYHKLNRFKKALYYLELLDDMLQRGKHGETYLWPGLLTVIDETKLDHLKTLLTDLIKQCENPPPPDATCRYTTCSLYPSIYYTDPDFKGFYSIQCSEQCCLQYHPQCWKSIKSSLNYTDKAFLEQRCYTPDCEGFIINIQHINKDGSTAKEFAIPDPKKSSKPKKSKLEKKLEVREEKKKKRRDSTRVDSTSEVPEELTKENIPEPENTSPTKEVKNQSKSETKDTNGSLNGAVTSQLSVDAEPFIVLKKEKLINENSGKIFTKMKEPKKVKSNTYSIDEFLQHSDAPLHGNEYQQRLNTLRVTNQNYVERIWSSSNLNSSCLPATSFTTDDIQPVVSTPPICNKTTEASENEDSQTASFDSDLEFPKPLVNVKECIKNNVYSYFKEMLGKYGPMRVDDPALLQKITNFPEEVDMIADSGGIGEFLQQNVDFAFVGETYVCLVEQLSLAYKKIQNATAQMMDFSITDDFQTTDSKDENSELFRFSFLNPDASEYRPGTSLSASSRDCSLDLVDATQLEKFGRNSPVLISAISKLRQPLSIDQEAIQKSNNSVSSMDLSQHHQTVCDVPERSRRSSSSSTFSCYQNTIDPSLGSEALELVGKCTEAIKIYFSEEVKEYRPYIDICLKPYGIVLIPNKSSKRVQTEETVEVEKVSRGTMKVDEEFQKLREIVSNLIEDKLALLEDRKRLEEQCHSALDSATKYQKRSGVECLNLRRELEDANSVIEEQKREFKSRECKLEKEVQTLSEALKKAKNDNLAQKNEMDKLMSKNESLKLDRIHLEEGMYSLQQEQQQLRLNIGQEKTLKERVASLEIEKVEANKRALNAELLLLRLKRTEFLKRIDIKKAEAAQKIREIQDGIKLVSAGLTPVYIQNLKALLTQIQHYTDKLDNIQKEFTARIDEQINAVNNGAPLGSLKPFNVPDLPDIPTWNAQNATFPAFDSQAASMTPQMFNSTFNPNNLMNAFSYSLNSVQGPNQSVPKRNHQDLTQQNPPSDVRKNAAGEVQNQLGNQSLAPLKKSPPGLQNLPASSSHATTGSMYDMHSELKPQVVAGKTKLPESSAILTPAASSNLNSTAAKSASNFTDAAPISNVKKPSEKAGSPPLELDYKIKSNEPLQNCSVAATAQASSSNLKSANSGSKKNLEKDVKRSFEKLLNKLQEKFPKHSQMELAASVKEFRGQRSSGLSGLSLDKIITGVSAIIENKMKSAANQALKKDNMVKPQSMPNVVLVNKKLVSTDSKPKEMPKESLAQKKCAWGNSESSRQWSGNSIDDYEECIICHEDMTDQTAYKVDCGHSFHLKCIREWLNKKSDCPLCRVHLLLPEDYPALN